MEDDWWKHGSYSGTSTISYLATRARK